MVTPLPCPFCGGTNITVIEGDTFRWRLAECQECGSKGSDVRIQTMGEGTQEEWEEAARIEAIEAWNTRAEPQGPAGDESDCPEPNEHLLKAARVHAKLSREG